MPGAGYTASPGYLGMAGAGLGDDTLAYGGFTVPMLAGAAIAVGDAVYLSAASHVSKGVAANNALILGVVVGGKGTKGRTYPEARIGDVAAAAAEDWVLVCFLGKVRAVADAAIAAGARVSFGATAGRLDDPTTDATTVVGTTVGKALTAAGGAAAEFDLLVSL